MKPSALFYGVFLCLLTLSCSCARTYYEAGAGTSVTAHHGHEWQNGRIVNDSDIAKKIRMDDGYYLSSFEIYDAGIWHDVFDIIIPPHQALTVPIRTKPGHRCVYLITYPNCKFHQQDKEINVDADPDNAGNGYAWEIRFGKRGGFSYKS